MTWRKNEEVSEEYLADFDAAVREYREGQKHLDEARESLKEKVLDMRQFWSDRAIARRAGVTPLTISAWVRSPK